MNKNIKLIILPILLGGLLTFAFFNGWFELGKQALISPTHNFITQYAGKPAFYGSFGWMYNYQFPLDFGSTAVIGDYKIVVETKSSGQKLGEPYCGANTCSGTQTGIENGCPIYEGLASTSFSTQEGCASGSTGGGKCVYGINSVGGIVQSVSCRGSQWSKEVSYNPSGSSVNWGFCVQNLLVVLVQVCPVMLLTKQLAEV